MTATNSSRTSGENSVACRQALPGAVWRVAAEQKTPYKKNLSTATQKDSPRNTSGAKFKNSRKKKQKK